MKLWTGLRWWNGCLLPFPLLYGNSAPARLHNAPLLPFRLPAAGNGDGCISLLLLPALVFLSGCRIKEIPVQTDEPLFLSSVHFVCLLLWLNTPRIVYSAFRCWLNIPTIFNRETKEKAAILVFSLMPEFLLDQYKWYCRRKKGYSFSSLKINGEKYLYENKPEGKQM